MGRASGADAGRLQIVNVASGEETNVLELAGRVRTLVAPGKDVRCRGLERPGDPQRGRADTTRPRAPGWRPQPFARRLAQCVAAWRDETR